MNHNPEIVTNHDFLMVFDNVLKPEECNEFINYFERLKSMNLVFDRQETQDGLKHEKNDETAFLLDKDVITLTKETPIFFNFLNRFWDCYKMYADTYSVLHTSEMHGMSSIRLQKTVPGQGYHNWHYESSDSAAAKRIVAWQLYLNTINEGGETEFLYLSKRVNPKEGRLVIWPTSYTHTHRGNPPLNKTKYVLTGWLEFLGNPKK